jgi:hypothetical protein
MPFFNPQTPQDQSSFLSLPHSSICPMPTGWDLYLTLPLSKDLLDQLKPADLLELQRHLHRMLRDVQDCPEMKDNVNDMICSIVERLAEMSKEQYNLWERGFGFPVYGPGDRMAEFFVDQEGLDKVREERGKKEGECGECGMRGGAGAEQHTDEHQPSENTAKEKPIIRRTRLLAFTNGAISYENTFFPDCGGSFLNVHEYEAYVETLTKEKKALLDKGVLRIVDRSPSAWEVVGVDEANAEVEKLESMPFRDVKDDDEEVGKCICSSDECESCEGSEHDSEDDDEDKSETEDGD